MSTVEDRWSTVSSDILEALARHLRRTGRWHLDGSSLRSLNRHWCSSLDLLVIRIHPHCDTVLPQSDIQSLSKFQNLTSLDAVPFEGGDADTREKRCLQLIEVLTQLSHLKYLRLHNLMDYFNAENLRSIGSESGLEFEIEKRFKDDVWFRIYGLDVEYMIGEFSFDTIGDLVRMTPSLKPLLRDGSWQEAEEGGGGDRDGDGLKMRICKEQDLLSLKMIYSLPNAFDPVKRYTKLKWLKCYLANGNILTCTAFQRMQKRLTSLKLSRSSSRSVSARLIEGAIVLERLIVHRCQLHKDFVDAIDRLPLKKLSLEECCLMVDRCTFQNCSSLRELNFSGNRFQTTEAVSWHLPRNLERLKMTLDDVATKKILDEVSRMASLECLEIFCNDPRTSSDFLEVVERLPRLRSLHCLGSSWISSEKIVRMASLINLQELCIHATALDETRPDVEALKEQLKEKAPQLRFQYQPDDSATKQHAWYKY